MHVHDSHLKAYLRNSFPSVRDFDDVVQESYLRAWKARIKHPIHTAKGFLFEIARHIAVDLIRRQKVSPIEQIGNLSGLPVIEDNSAVVEIVSENEKIAFVADAMEEVASAHVVVEVVMLRKLKNLPRRQVAARLMISEKAVDERLSRGMRRLGHIFRDRGIDGYFPS